MLEHIKLESLAESVAGAMPALDPTDALIAVQTYRLLIQGEPVRIDQVAEEADVSLERAQQVLSSWPGVFFDEGDVVVGFWGLAQPEMPHRFDVDGETLCTWCAWDALFIPEIIGRRALVESTSPGTGEKVSLTVDPDGVKEYSPTSAVVSFLVPERSFDHNVILNFCHYVHFFTSEEAAQGWLAKHDGTFLLSIEDAFELGRLTNQRIFGTVLA